ncbi:MAG: sigma-54-dependent Fis family transcriptional regulator [Fimbriimonadaceae bacterium]|nr:sigma-54-dependent Fis family transcriptional regulator [Fimbriimonadaceae bacterium]QYK58611.1 MAG: sigma-54-dependent Fis family transcriptional regulator [Fimbriimonadaceae bacterium]
MNKKHILVVDDEPNIRKILEASFDRSGWSTTAVGSAEEGLAALEQATFDCVLTDVTMPGMDGIAFQAQVAKLWPEVPVVVMTAYGTIPQAVGAIREGAFDYITKPFDLDGLKKLLMAAMSDGGSSPAKKAPKRKLKTRFIAESPLMMEVLETVRQVADSRATVLVTGESGTGKEVVAKLIHELSPRSQEAFVAVSCAALPESLLESELFGYEKGAFTGATGSKLGRFELADKGTLFLDEIGEVPIPIQIKLLRVLQEREFERLGATKPTRVDVRLVTATNRDLQVAVDEGVFRLDLLYRLQVVEVHLPPLRERQEDILPLAKHFLARSSQENGRQLTEIAPAALEILQGYGWPGNVRELENTIERAVALASRDETVLTEKLLPKSFRSAA